MKAFFDPAREAMAKDAEARECCMNADWRFRPCEYHQGFEDGYDAALGADQEHDIAELIALLHLAGDVAAWGAQMRSHFANAPGGKHFMPKYLKYMNARIDYFATRRPLDHSDFGGCICGPLCAEEGDKRVIDPECSYHRAAKAQPWNHRIPWNCPTYWDGCNCVGGPYYQQVNDE